MTRATLFWACLLLGALVSHADSILPYSLRTAPYSGFNPTVTGSIRSVGTSGSNVGLPDTYLASENNPAGLAMTLSSVALQTASNDVKDLHIQNEQNSLTTRRWGAAINPDPWGFSLGFASPTSEGGQYFFPGGGSFSGRIKTEEIKGAAATRIFRDRLAVGLGIGFVKTIWSMDMLQTTSYDFYLNAGLLLKLDNHLLFGIGYRPGGTSSSDQIFQSAPVSASFIQPVLNPYVLSTGMGWMPNRFFKAGVTALIVGATPEARLLSDQTIAVGSRVTVQPRIGGSYIFVQYPTFEMEAMAGTYYEVSRIQGKSSRLHGTFGIELTPWFYSLGFGVDRAPRYSNYLVTLGIDIVRALRAFEIIPPDRVPSYNGSLPPPTRVSNIGLPGYVGEHPKENDQVADSGQPTLGDVVDMAEKTPMKIKEKLTPRDRQEDGTFALGLEAGELSGINAKQWITNNGSVELLAGYSLRHYLGFELSRQWYVFTAEGRRTRVMPYAGLGVLVAVDVAGKGSQQARFFQNKPDPVGFGGRGTIGIEYLPRKSRFSVFAELSPSLGFYPRFFSFLSGAVGGRVYF